MMHGQKNIKSR